MIECPVTSGFISLRVNEIQFTPGRPASFLLLAATRTDADRCSLDNSDGPPRDPSRISKRFTTPDRIPRGTIEFVNSRGNFIAIRSRIDPDSDDIPVIAAGSNLVGHNRESVF